RIEVSEYQRPRRERGSGTVSRKTRRSAASSGLRGPSLANTEGIGEDETADTGTFLITWLRHLNDHGSRVRSVIHPNPHQPHASWVIPGTCTRPVSTPNPKADRRRRSASRRRIWCPRRRISGRSTTPSP